MESASDERMGLPSCSELHRHMACPGYNALKLHHPKPKETKEAVLGTDIHEILRLGDVEFADASSFKVAAAIKCDAIANRITEELLDEQLTAMVPVHIIKETRMWLETEQKNMPIERILSGQSDKIVICGDAAVMIDYKTLPGMVDDACDNWQIIGNLVCFKSALDRGKFKSMGVGEVTKYYGVIVQPSVTLDPAVVEYSSHDIDYAREMIESRLAANSLVGSTRLPGAHCKHCPVGSHCVEGASMGMVIHKTVSALTLSGQQLAEIYPKLSAIENICEQIKERMKMMLKSDADSIPGYQLSMVKGRKTIVDLRGVRDAVADAIPREEFSSLLKLSIGDLNEAYTKKFAHGGVTKASAEKALAKAIEPFCRVGDPSFRIVKREEPTIHKLDP